MNKKDNKIHNLIKAAAKKKSFEAAEKKYKKALERNPTHLHLLETYAMRALSDGWYRKSAEVWDKVLVLDPTNVTALKLQGVCYIATEDHWEARENFEKALEIDASDKEIFDLYAESNFHCWDLEEAVETWTHSDHLQASHQAMMFYALCQLDLFPSARDLASQLLERVETSPLAFHPQEYVYIVEGLIRLNDTDNALKLIDNHLLPNNSETPANVHRLKGEVLTMMQCYPEAAQSYSQAIDNSTDEEFEKTDLYIRRVKLHLDHLRNIHAATQDLENVLSIHPEFGGCEAPDTFYETYVDFNKLFARCSLHNEEYVLAMKHIDHSEHADPLDGEGRWIRAHCLEKLERISESREEYVKS